MSHNLNYPVTLTPDEEDGGFVVTFRDVPEAITQGEDVPDALAQAADALEEAIAGRIRRSDEIPVPSEPREGQAVVPVPALTTVAADPEIIRELRAIDEEFRSTEMDGLGRP